MRLNSLPSPKFWTSLFLGLRWFTWPATQATAQLWDVPPLPPVKYVQAQDAGDGYDYEHGAQSVIPAHWSESIRTLRIGQQEGTCPGMAASIETKIVFVTAGHGTGLESTDNPDKLVDYAGEATSVHAP
jgi:uncharacterized protein DUF5110